MEASAKDGDSPRKTIAMPEVTFPALSDWTDTAGAARALGIQPSTLREWRNRGKGPPHVRINQKIYRYRLSDIASWLCSQVVSPSEGK